MNELFLDFFNICILSTAVAHLRSIAFQNLFNDPHSEINTSNLPVLEPFNTVVCGKIIVWTRPLLHVKKGPERLPKLEKKNGQIFEPKMFGLQLYHRNAAPSTSIKRGSNGPAYQMRKIRQKKMEGERTEGKTRDQIAKKKKKKKKKKK